MINKKKRLRFSFRGFPKCIQGKLKSEFKIYGFTEKGFHPSIYNIILLRNNTVSLGLRLKRAPFTGQSVWGEGDWWDHVSIYKSNPGGKPTLQVVD